MLRADGVRKMTLDNCRFRQSCDVEVSTLRSNDIARTFCLCRNSSRTALKFSRIGLRVWQHLKRGRTADEIAQHLRHEVNAHPEKARKYVLSLIEKLMAFRVIAVAA